MKKKDKYLLLIISLDNEFESAIIFLLNILHKENISHSIEYHKIGYVEMNIYLPIESLITKDKSGLLIKWRDVEDELDTTDHFRISNKMLLEMSITEVTKVD